MSSLISKDGLLSDLKHSKEARDLLRRVFSKTHMAAQVTANRKKRGWSQDMLGRMISESEGNQQPAIARIENPEYGKMSLSTMFELADAFDVVFWGEFISFEDMCRRVTSDTTTQLAVPSFDESLQQLERWASHDDIALAAPGSDEAIYPWESPPSARVVSLPLWGVRADESAENSTKDRINIKIRLNIPEEQAV